MPSQQDRAKSVFLSALEISDRDARIAHVAVACGGDAALQREVDQLLLHHEAGALARFLETPQAETSDLLPVRAPLGASPERTGAILAGRYKLMEEIGAGGMGTVWMAHQSDPVRRTVAVKLIKAGMDTRAVLARFEVERQALALMDHPNIARVLDAGETADGRPFFVMELVKGVPITQFCDDRKLTIRERLELFVPVCQAVQHAHQKGVIHRDIKPSNVLVAMYDETPVPKVIDFGVAKAAGQPLTEMTLATKFGAVVGTPEYMSPEQASFNNLDVDTRSDVYSLGVLLYELLAGAPPFGTAELREAGLLELLRSVREVEPPRPSAKLSTAGTFPALAANRSADPARLTAALRGELDWVVMKALEKDRSRRYDTPSALARDVQRYLADEAVDARPPSRAYRLRRFARKNRRVLIVASAFVVLILGAAAVSFWQADEIRKERDRVVQARGALRGNLTRQMADSIRADLRRLASVGNALTDIVQQGRWDEKQFVIWMTRQLEREPEILGMCIAFEPGTFAPALDPATVREPPLLLPAAPDQIRDGYSLYVRRLQSDPLGKPIAEALKLSYHYRKQGWYANTLSGSERGWEEPSRDAYGRMVAYTAPLHLSDGRRPVGVLCLDVSLAYFRRLDNCLKSPAFGDDSYAFVVSAKGKVISHPHLREHGGPEAAEPFPDLIEHSRESWQDAAFADVVRQMLEQAGDGVGQARALDPVTGRRSLFQYTRVETANWVLVTVIPDDAH
ncbi:MAG: protein kinase [Gemmataceae bacterium]